MDQYIINSIKISQDKVAKNKEQLNTLKGILAQNNRNISHNQRTRFKNPDLSHHALWRYTNLHSDILNPDIYTFFGSNDFLNYISHAIELKERELNDSLEVLEFKINEVILLERELAHPLTRLLYINEGHVLLQRILEFKYRMWTHIDHSLNGSITKLQDDYVYFQDMVSVFLLKRKYTRTKDLSTGLDGLISLYLVGPLAAIVIAILAIALTIGSGGQIIPLVIIAILLNLLIARIISLKNYYQGNAGTELLAVRNDTEAPSDVAGDLESNDAMSDAVSEPDSEVSSDASGEEYEIHRGLESYIEAVMAFQFEDIDDDFVKTIGTIYTADGYTDALNQLGEDVSKYEHFLRLFFKSHLSFGESHSSILDDASQKSGINVTLPMFQYHLKVYVSKLIEQHYNKENAPSDNVGDHSLFSSGENSHKEASDLSLTL